MVELSIITGLFEIVNKVGSIQQEINNREKKKKKKERTRTVCSFFIIQYKPAHLVETDIGV